MRRLLHYAFGRVGGHDAPAAVPAFGAEVYHPIGFGNHVQIVFDDDHAVASAHQAVQHANQLVDVGPEGGHGGGRIVAEATPEGVVQRGTHTGAALAAVLAPKSARRLADDAVCAD